MSLKALLFDLDGTLLDTLTDLANAVNHTLKTLGFPLRTTDEVRSFIGSGVPTLIKRAIPEGCENPRYDEAVEVFTAYYLEHMEDFTCPYDGIPELLERLKVLGYKIAVVSNKRDDATKELCGRIFGGLYDFAVGATGENDRKPAPDMVFRVLEAFGIKRNEAIYIGDSDIDVLTAKNAGIKQISVLWGYRNHTELLKAGAEQFVRTTKELFEIIKGE